MIIHEQNNSYSNNVIFNSLLKVLSAVAAVKYYTNYMNLSTPAIF